MSRLIGALVLVLAWAAAGEARRVVLSCQQGALGSEHVHGIRHGDRYYDFCQLPSDPADDSCIFAFCPSLDYVLLCSLHPQCLEPSVSCTNPDVTREEYIVAPRSGRRLGRLVLQRDGGQIVLKCRPRSRVIPLRMKPHPLRTRE